MDTCNSPFVLFVLIFIFHTVHSATTRNEHKGFTVELFNRRRPHFSTYNSTFTTKKVIRIQSDVKFSFANFAMKLAIGTPPLEFIGEVDTGSDLIWSQCQPCDRCYEQTMPIYDPMRSSTYQIVRRGFPMCNSLGRFGVRNDRSEKCSYSYTYMDGSFSRGILASETLTFEPISGTQKVSVPLFAFGCGHTNLLTPSNKGVGGIIGLGRGPLSLVSQLGSSVRNRFSYCFVSRTDTETTTKLRFGDDVVFLGTERLRRTPLITPHQDLETYLLNLTYISVNDQMIKVPENVVNPELGGGFVIDSGTALTKLSVNIYYKLWAALKEGIMLQETKPPGQDFDVCYTIDPSIDLDVVLPIVTFHFDRDADWRLPRENAFPMVEDNVICSVFVNAMDTNGLSIFGHEAQQNFHVEYDLGNNVLSFAPTDCSKG